MRVLIVDNCVAVRERLLDLLRSSDGVGQVVQAADATSALAVVRDDPMDVAIVDLALGCDSGLDLIRELRAACSNMVLVVLTNSSTDIHREASLRRGAHFFFDKSLDFERAIAVVGLIGGTRNPRRVSPDA